jgi:hypothetical protein
MIIDKIMITQIFNRALNFSLNQLNSKFYSTNSSNNITPVKSYENADLDKQNILEDNKGKSGVYQWVSLW